MTAGLNELFEAGIGHLQTGRLAEAEACFLRVLALCPGHPDALHLLGVVAFQMGKADACVEFVSQAIRSDKRNPAYFFSLGNGLQALGRLDDALAAFDTALTLKPDFVEALSNRGNALQGLERFDEALESYDKALFLKPSFAAASHNRGNALQKLSRFDEAVESYDNAVKLHPNYAEALYSRGNALQALKRYGDAVESYNRALALKPDFADAFYNSGNALQELKRFGEALASFDKALALKPDFAEALNNRGNALNELKRFDEALASYDKALALKPDYAEALNNRGNALNELKRFDEALASYDKALALKPDYAEAFGGVIWCVCTLCEWGRKAALAGEMIKRIVERRAIVPPFALLGCSGDPVLQLQCAKNHAAGRLLPLPQPLWTGAKWRHNKVRIAYLSADFREHPVAHLMAELFERHDRSRFEVIALSFGADDGSDMRKRLLSAFDRFVDVRGKSDKEAALVLHNLQADIAIDLMGHTNDSQPGILAHRPAPVQVNYLGYPGTTGTAFIDYIVADNIVAPFEHQAFYTEKIVHLPDCYQVNDSKRIIAKRTPTRQEAGLPEEGFVFCCFNQNWKITPEVFDVWMRLLNAIESSVLWLLRDNKSAERKLRHEAQARGVDPTRLVFADRSPSEDHLARHRLADLFLDTTPYNAHTTASDALRVGVPVVTQLGEAFAGRVAASLLNAIGLPELVTRGMTEYEALALRLAREPVLLEGYRNRLNTNRLTHPLFDTDRFRRNIETAYTQMWEIWQRGEQPRSFRVEAEGTCIPR
jgi:protein O-GlcNAc transferase